MKPTRRNTSIHHRKIHTIQHCTNKDPRSTLNHQNNTPRYKMSLRPPHMSPGHAVMARGGPQTYSLQSKKPRTQKKAS